MADDIDRATESLERELKEILANRQPIDSPKASGKCLTCGDIIKEKGRRWCDAECRDDWDTEHARKRR